MDEASTRRSTWTEVPQANQQGKGGGPQAQPWWPPCGALLSSGTDSGSAPRPGGSTHPVPGLAGHHPATGWAPRGGPGPGVSRVPHGPRGPSGLAQPCLPPPSQVPAAAPPQPGPPGVPAGPAPAAPADTPRPGPLHHWSGQLQTLGLLRKLPPCGPPDGAWPGAASQGTKLSLLRACLRKPQQGHQSREPASEKGLTVGKASPLETALRNTTWQAPGCWPGLVRNSGTEAACRTWAPS